MKFISLFAGVGGFDLALSRAGHECVYANDIDKYCKIIYDKHFKHKLDCRSITQVDTSEIPNHELLVGGFPCQSFSVAGKRRGFEDTRGTLFFEIARILRDKQPRLFILENVKGLLSHNGGQTFKTIITTITELGYDCQWQVLNSKNFGVPQNRERVFIVGHLRGTSRPEVFFIETITDESLPTDTKETGFVTQTITSQAGMNARGSFVRVGTLRTHKDGNGFREIKSGISPTIPARAREDGSGQPIIIQDTRGVSKKQNGKGYKQSQESYTIDTLSTQGIISKTVRSGGRGSPHGSKQNWDSYDVDGAIRRLTPIECERLQGFPDNWTQGVSDAQRYKMMGNAVTVNVVYEIVKRLS